MQPTGYPDVNDTLRLLGQQQQQVLGPGLVGVYLGGSLALGDFDPGSSDIDYLAVTAGPVPEQLLPELAAMHDRVAASGLRWAAHLEVSYIPRQSLRRHDPADCRHPSIGVTWPFGVHVHDESWVIQRWTIREHGVTVWGPPPADLIDPVPPRQLQAAVAGLLLGEWSRRVDDPPDWLRPRAHQAYAILTMCRAWHTLQTGAIASKPVAAAWAREALPHRAGLIDRALGWRHDAAPDDMPGMLEFVRETVAMAGTATGRAQGSTGASSTSLRAQPPDTGESSGNSPAPGRAGR